MDLRDFSDEELKKELKERETERFRRSSLPPEQRLAEDLHQHLCHANHTDGCSWGYEFENETHNWLADEHGIWLRKALEALDVLNDPEKIMEIIKIVK